MLINLNRGENEELKAASRTLAGYSEFVARIREYTGQNISVANAVDRTVNECIKEGILADFLKKNKSEVVKMSIYEYDEEGVKKVFRRDGEDDMASLYQYLIRDNRVDDMNKAVKDIEFRDKLFIEYGIR